MAVDYSDKCITMNGKEYIVIEQINYENGIYVYLVNDKDDTDTMFAEIKGNDVVMINPELFEKKLLPMFLEKIGKNTN
jgi:hypothetical protein